MGYYTSYSLTWKTPTGINCAAADERDNAIGNAIDADPDEIGFALHRCGNTSDSCKWYDHEEHMKSLSVKFPGVLFTLSGEGEESGDIWKKYFLDGKMQICKAVLDFPKFDAKLLK